MQLPLLSLFILAYFQFQMKFFKRGSKKSEPSQISASVSTQDVSSTGHEAKATTSEKRGSALSLSESSLHSYAYPSIREKDLKDIFKAVWTEDYSKTRNILSKNKSKVDSQDSEKR